MPIKKLIRFDWAMKYILRNKANFDVLEGFISILLKEEIRIEGILESESNQDAENRKFNRVDLKCKDLEGREIIIEIQNQREVDYLQRLLWGTSKAVVESIELGSNYKNVVKVISISILYHTMRIVEKENTDFIYYGTTIMKGVHTNKPLELQGSVIKGIDSHLVTSKSVFPEYYMIYVEKFEDVINEELDEWMYFFKHGEIKEDFKSPGILLAAKKLGYLMMNEKEKKAYDEYLVYLGYELSLLDTAKADGIAEGKAEGVELKAIRVAKKMIKRGEAHEIIAEDTELSIEVVRELAKESTGK